MIDDGLSNWSRESSCYAKLHYEYQRYRFHVTCENLTFSDIIESEFYE